MGVRYEITLRSFSSVRRREGYSGDGGGCRLTVGGSHNVGDVISFGPSPIHSSSVFGPEVRVQCTG